MTVSSTEIGRYWLAQALLRSSNHSFDNLEWMKGQIDHFLINSLMISNGLNHFKAIQFYVEKHLNQFGPMQAY